MSGRAENGVWVVVYKGPTTVHDRMEALSECCRRSQGNPFVGVLVDLREATLEMSTYDEFTLATEVSAQSFLVGKRIAVLQSSDCETNNLFLTAAQNRGVIARVFHDEDEAWRFLTRKPRGSAVAPAG